MELLKFISPNTLSLLTTYYCTAACKNCCFECNQERRGRMSFKQMETYISECVKAFPMIRLVAFSGGECFSLKDDLYQAIYYAHKKGLITRVITNGYWAVSYKKALGVLELLKELGLNELNLSTGDDHQKWVPFDHIVNAIRAAAKVDLPCLVNIETNPSSQFSEEDFKNHEELKEYIRDNKVIFSSGIWIPFDMEDKIKRDTNYNELIRHRYVQRPIISHGCNSLFESIPIDPEGNVYACCGLACRKAKFLKIGNINTASINKIYTGQFDDFLKVWAYVDGPKFILNKIAMETGKNIELNADMHNCEACLLLLNDPSKIEYIKNNISRYISEVLLKYNIKRKKVNNEK